MLESQIKGWRELNQEDSEFMYELSSCLPDQMSEESVYGRCNEIAPVKDLVENEEIAAALITAGPGIGKTTVARMAAQKLKETGQTVLFCGLQGKKTFDEVATEMIHSCRKMPGQLPDSLEYWLKNWSKQISRQPTILVLDNAEVIIELEADRALFLEILSTMRMLSNNKLTFVRACLHGGGGPQVGEVTRLAVVEKKPAFTCQPTTPGSRGEVSRGCCVVVST